MKRKTIISLVLTASLLLIGAVAYGYWNDYGDYGYYGTGHGYNYDADYNTNVNAPSAYRDKDRNGAPYDYSRSYRNDRTDYRYPRRDGNGWTSYGWYGMMGPRGCW